MYWTHNYGGYELLLLSSKILLQINTFASKDKVVLNGLDFS